MAYNPFDDVILQDPAYMSNGGGLQVDLLQDKGFQDFFKLGRDYLQSQGEDPFGGAYSVADIERIGRDIANAQPGQANVMAQQPVQEPPTTVPVPQFISEGEQIRDKQEKLQQIEDTVPGAFYQSMQDVYKQRQQEDFTQQKKMMGTAGEYAYDFFVPQETAERAKEKTEKNKQILEQLGFNLGQMNREQMAEAKAQGYDPLTIGESLSKIPDFLFGDQLKGFQKLAKGEPLEPGEGYALLSVPLDVLDFAGIGLLGGVAASGVYKLIRRLKNKYFDEAGVPDIKGILDNQNYAFDPDVQEAKRIFGSPAQIPGLPIEQGGRGQTVMMDVADRPGATSVATKTTPYSYLEKDVNKYLNSLGEEDIASPSGLLKYLKANNIKLNVENKYRNELSHVTNALNEFKGTRKIFTGYVNPWMIQTSEILNKLDKPIYIDDLAKQVEEALAGQTGRGKKINAGTIRQWLKGNPEQAGLTEKGLNNLIVKNNKYISKTQGLHYEIKDQLDELLSKLESGEIEQNMGYKNYPITLSDGTTKKLEDIAFELKRGQARDKKGKALSKDSMFNIVGIETIEQILPRTIKIKGGEGVVDENLLKYYIPEPTKQVGNVYQQNLQFIKDLYRPGGFGVFKDFDELAQSYGLHKILPNDPDAPALRAENRERINKLTKDIQSMLTSTKGGEKAFNKNQLQAYRKVIDDSVRLSQYNRKKFIETLNKSPELKQKLIDEYTQYYNDKVEFDPVLKKKSAAEKQKYLDEKLTETNIINAGMKAFEGHVSHIFKIEDFRTKDMGMEFMGAIGNMVRTNVGIENFALQPKAENAIRAAIKSIKNGIKNDSVEDMRTGLNTILYYQKLLNRKGMGAYIRIDKKDLTPDVSRMINNFLINRADETGVNSARAGTISKEGAPDKISEKFNDIFIGSEKPLTLEQNMAKFDDLMNYYLKNPDKLTVTPPTAKPFKEPKTIEGVKETPYKRAGFINTATSDIEKNTSFKKGGAVRMAIGGDPLTNLNQQQFAPDPAFDDDYFQQAVESGNLQAVNLFNLFKVFKKPKVMATPSNVKQVEQARDPMPQGVPGSQELQPLPAGKPDFFFKSYLLDQLNSPNAPKANTPQGWREFLIKGRKVPEAEMLDTGILQYLEDTEKFYPNKKITKQEIEDLYDTSPLGNLEVRVKPVRGYPEGENVPQESFEFFADQGTQKHRGVGSAAIDESMDTYFEVVVNVPNLPGQERAYINSAHFSEPNVLGFTRVGTYKNNKGETVAVIQEMQTDMLTEVRKEQERLFAMVNALKRNRAKLVDQIQNYPASAEYYKNELRLFDQKYPPDRLDALETDNLIQPFPNIVAKDLIPERTASLNSIQEQINKLIMANVEQYNDPAYKTMVFDLAQQQNKIFEDLSSMNRSANYEESLKDFKVPATGERDDLERIAYRDEYLPNDYELRQVTSFPPIPFNKQADYVDLLLKSTIKAAKGKGIDKVAIMPADVGANPRWRKTTDEAKKKFQNLYDKVGVQQLKNIAKKYGGKLEIEKIIDKNKTTRGLTFLNKNPDGEFQILKQTETRKEISDADRDKYYDEEITRIASGVTEPGDVVLTREIAPGQMMDYYVVEGRGDATDVGYRMIPLKDGESADNAMIKIVEYNPSEVDMYTISFDPSKLEEPMYLFKKKSGGTIDKDSLVSITDIYGEYGR